MSDRRSSLLRAFELLAGYADEDGLGRILPWTVERRRAEAEKLVAWAEEHSADDITGAMQGAGVGQFQRSVADAIEGAETVDEIRQALSDYSDPIIVAVYEAMRAEAGR